MRTLKGPGLFLAQFAGPKPPFNSLQGLGQWAADLGYVGLQVPSSEASLLDLEKAAASKDYCDEITGQLQAQGLSLCELSCHLQGQLVAVHPAYDQLFDRFAPPALRGRPKERQAWAQEQVALCLKASEKLGLSTMVTFSGALAWPYFYPWPQRPAALVEEAFLELARRWRPLLELAEASGVDCAFELHPGEDLHDGVTFERFLTATGNPPRLHLLYDPSHFVLQALDYLEFIDIYHEHIRAFHVKDAEFQTSGRSGVYGGYLPWRERPGRFRSLGDGQIDWGGVFTRLAAHDYPGWAVVEWECPFKDPAVGAAQGAPFVKQHIIQAAAKAFDDFAGGSLEPTEARRILGLW